MRISRIEGVLFDKDGTLTDYAASWGPLNRRAADCASRGDRALAERLLQVGGWDRATGRVVGDSLLAASNTRVIAEAWVAAGAPHTADALAGKMDEIFADGAAHAVPVTDIAAMFERLRRRHLCIGIATSDSERAGRATLARLGVSGEDIFLAGYDSGYGVKPEPGMVHAFCAAHELPAERVAVVGDNLHDIRMGRAAGCAVCIAVLTGTGTMRALQSEADYVIDSASRLESLMDSF